MAAIAGWCSHAGAVEKYSSAAVIDAMAKAARGGNVSGRGMAVPAAWITGNFGRINRRVGSADLVAVFASPSQRANGCYEAWVCSESTGCAVASLASGEIGLGGWAVQVRCFEWDCMRNRSWWMTVLISGVELGMAALAIPVSQDAANFGNSAIVFDRIAVSEILSVTILALLGAICQVGNGKGIAMRYVPVCRVCSCSADARGLVV